MELQLELIIRTGIILFGRETIGGLLGIR